MPQLEQWLQSLKASPATYSAIGFTILVTVHVILAIAVWTGNSSGPRSELKQLRRLGISHSNMADQNDPKFDITEDAPANGPVRVKALFIHPVKSCAPIELDRAQLIKTGFMHDRSFAIAAETPQTDERGVPIWRFISQRTKPYMSQIKTQIWVPHKGSDPNDPLVQAGGCLVLSFPDPDTPSWMNRLEKLWSRLTRPEISCIVPLRPTPAQMQESNIRIRPFAIHSRDAKGLDMGDIPSVSAALPFLKTFLKVPDHQGLTIFKCTPDTLVRTDKNLAPLQHIGSPAFHGYTDQQPVNINSLSSVHAVSALLPKENQPLNALRFRANIWITGAPAYDEESWKRCRIGAGAAAPTLSVVCRTSRCTMPNVDPNTGEFDADVPPPGKDRGRPQPSTTLVKHRTVEDGNPRALGYLGMHCVPEDQTLSGGLYVEVGDEIEVLERGVHLYGSTADEY
ncbi:hypothetical protein ACJ41O_014605 [Fusarium nematophilum]